MLQSLTVNFFQANFAELRKLLAFASCKLLCEENDNPEYDLFSSFIGQRLFLSPSWNKFSRSSETIYHVLGENFRNFSIVFRNLQNVSLKCSSK